MLQQEKFQCTFMRVGTSKAVFFKENNLPEDRTIRDKVILAALGSPDVRQIDGLGGGDVSTSKVGIVSRSKHEAADIDYTFGQVSLDQAFIDYSGNCGNCSSGVAPFVVDEGMVAITEPITTVRVFNTNTKKMIIQHVEVVDGKAAVEGDYMIDGIPGTGSKIELDFKDSAGATTGKLLPTGNRQDLLDLKSLGKVPVTIVDLGNPVVFVYAKYVGATGKENRPQINADPDLLERIETVRNEAAKVSGIINRNETARIASPMKPLVVFFAEAQDCVDYVSGNVISGERVDFIARNIMNQSAIETFAVTAALCTGIASIIKGTVLNEVALRKNPGDLILFGNPRGITDVSCAVKEDQKGGVIVEKASMGRTARRIMDGMVYIRNSIIE